MLPDNIHIFTMDGFLEFHAQGRFFELEIQRHGVVLVIGIPRTWGVSRGGRQGCKCTNEQKTLLTTVESKIDKHRSIIYVFTFIYRGKL